MKTKYYLFLTVLVLGIQQPVAAQQLAGAGRGVQALNEQLLNKTSNLIQGAIQNQDGSFSTTLYTFDQVTIFSYFHDTEIQLQNIAGDTLSTDTLAANTYKTIYLSSGVYRVNGSKSFTVLIGDATTNSVQGFFAVDQSGRGTSTLLNTYMMGSDWGSERFIVFAYDDETSFSIRNLDDNTLLFAGTLDKGEHFTMPQTPYSTFLQVSSNKPVSALSYADQDYYVPSANGTFSGTLFYGYSAYIGNWSNSITVTSYHNENPVLVTNSVTGDTLMADTLDVGQVITYAVSEETYWTVESEKTVTAANIPFVSFSGSYLYMTRAVDETGIGAGTLFYVPTIGSRIDVFSFEDNNEVLITYLGTYSEYPYPDNPDTVYSGTMQAGNGYYFNSLTGSHVYKIEGTGNLSVVQSYQGFGAEFMPLSYAQELPDLAINENGLSFNPPDSTFSAGDMVTVTLAVYNYGPVDAFNVEIALYDGNINNEGTAPVIDSKVIPMIAGQDSVVVEAFFVVPADPEYRQLSLVVDPDDEITESNSSNNSIIRPLVPNKDLLPPLPVAITAPSGLDLEEDTLTNNPFTVTADIFNEGTVNAENVVIQLQTFNGLSVIEGNADTSIAAIAGKGSVSLSWKIMANKDSSGTNKYMLFIDADNVEAKNIYRSVYVPDIVPPANPKNLAAAKSTENNHSVLLGWTPNSENDVAGYEIYYGTESGLYDGTEANEGISPISISTFNEFELSGLDETATYYFAIKAFDGSNNRSAFSDEVSLSLATSINPELVLPKQFEISQNYPNPFNPSTKISYSLPKQAQVEIILYDILGREISTLVNEVKNAGTYHLMLDMKEYSSGIYIYRIKAGSYTQTRKLTLLK